MFVIQFIVLEQCTCFGPEEATPAAAKPSSLSSTTDYFLSSVKIVLGSMYRSIYDCFTLAYFILIYTYLSAAIFNVCMNSNFFILYYNKHL